MAYFLSQALIDAAHGAASYDDACNHIAGDLYKLAALRLGSELTAAQVGQVQRLRSLLPMVNRSTYVAEFEKAWGAIYDRANGDLAAEMMAPTPYAVTIDENGHTTHATREDYLAYGAGRTAPARTKIEPLDIDDSTQYATAHDATTGQPVATLQRRRVADKTGPTWKVFNVKGEHISSISLGGYSAKGITRHVEAALTREARKARLAETISDAPAFEPTGHDEIDADDLASKSRANRLHPTWASLVPAFCAVLEEGTEEGRKIAREELARMAQAADLWNTHQGEGKGR